MHSPQEVGRKKKLAQYFKKWESYISVLKNKQQKLFLGGRRGGGGWKIRYFLSKEVDGNMIFIDCWKVLVLNFSGMRNTVFFEANSYRKYLYLLITEMFLYWTFRGWKMRSLFESKSWWKDDIYWLLKSSWFGIPKSSCFELFGDGK